MMPIPMNVLRRIKHKLQSWVTPRPARLKAHEIQLQLLDAQALTQVAKVFTEAHAAYYSDTLAAQTAGSLSVYVAWLQAQPVGIAYVHWLGHRSAQISARAPGVPEIYKVQVLRAQRSRGIGAMLITHIEQAAHKRGLAYIGLGVHSDNHRARDLYQRLGYVADPHPYFDEYDELDAHGQLQHHRIQALWMTKAL
jgi:ribosomal protein S18 acetylase RimI-like enzyme